MAFTELASLDADNTTALGGFNKKTGKKNPTSAEGYYLGSKKVESKKAKNGYAYLHILQTSKGNLGVWGKTDMDRKLLSAKPGTMVRVTHTGMQPTPNGEMYKFKVEVDSDNVIDVSGFNTNNESVGSGDNDSGNDYVGGSYGSDDEETTEADDEVPAAVAASANDRRAAVQAILNRKKN